MFNRWPGGRFPFMNCTSSMSWTLSAKGTRVDRRRDGGIRVSASSALTMSLPDTHFP